MIPFIVGEKVTVSWYKGSLVHLNDVHRTVLSVTRSPRCLSGWKIHVDGPNMHRENGGLALDAGWFNKVSYPSTNKIREKIKQGIAQGLTDKEIDAGFQRHVTKANLIQCIRQLLA